MPGGFARPGDKTTHPRSPKGPVMQTAVHPTTRRRHRTHAWVAAPFAAIVAALALCGPAGAATAPLGGSTLEPSPTVAPTPQGIIMSDGRICNPRWGC